MGQPPKETEEYISKALQAGTMSKDTIVLAVALATITGKPILEVQDALMDANVWLQQGFRNWNKKLDESINKGLGVSVTDPQQ